MNELLIALGEVGGDGIAITTLLLTDEIELILELMPELKIIMSDDELPVLAPVVPLGVQAANAKTERTPRVRVAERMKRGGTRAV